MAGSSSYGDLLWFQKIEAISVDLLDFGEKKWFHAFFRTQNGEKTQIGDCNSSKNNGFVSQSGIKMEVLIEEEAKAGKNGELFL